MSLNEQLNRLLQTFVSGTLDVEGAVLVTTDGLPLASVLGPGVDEDRIAAMGAAALSMGARTIGDLQRGTLEQVLLKGSGGYVMLVQAGSESVLEAYSNEDAKLGLLLYEMKQVAKQIAQIMR
ncbi:roadblock/LC7 domain-containing protein [Tessaracoccus sp. OH4464_COT-324]|uniref:roadblock/LC7 domain-containing protein n=1 Tax=Tessaracoccus sp. OH4464_COT-324 TaxID=2491059 RepID=UPI000F633451|nr:roadblock/LC7 domain-containing protein [Tessaracoccus sp. OH4464_COT-324]RRD47991.1 hypothetical protein EII42_01750 [Tessaracoccus sp. OH4464_COT-324]